MANLESIKADAARNTLMLRQYLRKIGLLTDTLEPVRDYKDEQEEVLHNALLGADDLARRLATL